MRRNRLFLSGMIAAALMLVPILAPVAWGQNMMTQRGEPSVGPVTRLPIPRFVSLRTDKANIRRGPSTRYKIDWVFVRKGLPLMVVGEFEHWRKVVDQDGAGGWVHFRLITGTRMAFVPVGPLKLREKPNEYAKTQALAEEGAVTKLGDCLPEWCEIGAGRAKGWVHKGDIWGVFADEVRE